MNGREYPLGYSLFEDEYEYEVDTDVSRARRSAFSDKLREYENTTAATYNTYLTQQRIMASSAALPTCLKPTSSPTTSPRDVPTGRSTSSPKKLAPAMRNAALVGKMNKARPRDLADLLLPLDAEFDPRVTIGESRNTSAARFPFSVRTTPTW